MSNPITNRLMKKIPEIMEKWIARADQEVRTAKHQESLALKNSLPEFLEHLSTELSQKIDRTESRRIWDRNEGERLGKKHGNERAQTLNYTMEQLILEYHILRQVIFDVMDEEVALDSNEREIIICCIEKAVNDAASEYSKTIRDLQTKLSQTLAHDLRNPLSAAKLGTQLILRKSQDAQFVTRKAEDVSRAIDRVDGMIRDLLDVSRIKAGEGAPLNIQETDLHELAENVCKDMNTLFPGRFVVVSPEKCIGHWDQSALQRVLENLLANAQKYGDEKSLITVRISQDGKNAEVDVHNEGNPIAKEEQVVLFEQFKRSQSSEYQEGWGLGLSLVKSMVEAHSGTIDVRSEEDTGTSFVFTIPKNDISGHPQ